LKTVFFCDISTFRARFTNLGFPSKEIQERGLLFEGLCFFVQFRSNFTNDTSK
jgi:hypothetical protein